MLQAQKEEYYQSGFPKVITRNKYSLAINDRLKMARNEKGYSISRVKQELERRGIKCGLSTIQGYEANEGSLNHRYPSHTMLIALASLYECSVDFILGISDELTPQTSDLRKILQNYKTLSWDGNAISDEERAKLLKKASQLMGKKL